MPNVERRGPSPPSCERDFDPDDAIPRIAWGKYREENGRLVLGMSLEVNHRLVDGLHIGLFARELDRVMDSLRDGKQNITPRY